MILPQDYMFTTETLDNFVEIILNDECPYDDMIEFIEIDIEYDGQQEKMALIFALTKQVYKRYMKTLIQRIA